MTYSPRPLQSSRTLPRSRPRDETSRFSSPPRAPRSRFRLGPSSPRARSGTRTITRWTKNLSRNTGPQTSALRHHYKHHSKPPLPQLILLSSSSSKLVRSVLRTPSLLRFPSPDLPSSSRTETKRFLSSLRTLSSAKTRRRTGNICLGFLGNSPSCTRVWFSSSRVSSFSLRLLHPPRADDDVEKTLVALRSSFTRLSLSAYSFECCVWFQTDQHPRNRLTF